MHLRNRIIHKKFYVYQIFATFISQLFNNNLFSITQRKLFGKYFHNIITHSPISYRNFSGSSLNVENEERTFKTLKSISSNTSSHHDGHVLGNLIIRIQAEENFKNENVYNSDNNNNNEIEMIWKSGICK